MLLCPEKCQTLSKIETHCKLYHNELVLKFRELVLDKTSGKSEIGQNYIQILFLKN